MGTRRYSPPGRADAAATAERIIEAAEALVREDRFHTATMEELAARAGVSRATLFTRFGSKLGLLEALHVRCAGSPEIAALHQAMAVEDPVESLSALVAASCRVWERWGGVQRHVRAIVVLEPEVAPLVEGQRTFQRESLETLARRLAKQPGLRTGITAKRAAVTLHMITGLEAFVELRHEGGLSLDQTIETLRELAVSLLDPLPQAIPVP